MNEHYAKIYIIRWAGTILCIVHFIIVKQAKICKSTKKYVFTCKKNLFVKFGYIFL